LPETSLHIIR